MPSLVLLKYILNTCLALEIYSASSNIAWDTCECAVRLSLIMFALCRASTVPSTLHPWRVSPSPPICRSQMTLETLTSRSFTSMRYETAGDTYNQADSVARIDQLRAAFSSPACMNSAHARSSPHEIKPLPAAMHRSEVHAVQCEREDCHVRRWT